MKRLKINIASCFILIFFIKQTSAYFCTEDEKCSTFALNHVETCRKAENYCSMWADTVQQYVNVIPTSVLRNSPWNASCSYEEYYCPLTFQCINKTENCTFNTVYQGCSSSSSTPWGHPCPQDHLYCPLLASCIPMNRSCSLEELNLYLQNPGHAYYGKSCSGDTSWCPGTQSCLLNTTECTYNKSLDILSPNITCPSYETFCIDERKCRNGSCISPSYPNYTVYENGTGWKQFCDNFKYICPKIISIEHKLKQVISTNTSCQIPCDRNPVKNCSCPSGRYKCDLRANCIDNTTACIEPANSVCASSYYPAVSSTGWPMSSSQNISSSIEINMTASIVPISSSSSYIWPAYTPVPDSPVCNYTCKTGRTYCPSLYACVLDGYYHCNKTSPYCRKGYTFCSVENKCIPDLSSCHHSPASTPTPTPSSSAYLIATSSYTFVDNASSVLSPLLSFSVSYSTLPSLSLFESISSTFSTSAPTSPLSTNVSYSDSFVSSFSLETTPSSSQITSLPIVSSMYASLSSSASVSFFSDSSVTPTSSDIISASVSSSSLLAASLPPSSSSILSSIEASPALSTSSLSTPVSSSSPLTSLSSIESSSAPSFPASSSSAPSSPASSSSAPSSPASSSSAPSSPASSASSSSAPSSPVASSLEFSASATNVSQSLQQTLTSLPLSSLISSSTFLPVLPEFSSSNIILRTSSLPLSPSLHFLPNSTRIFPIKTSAGISISALPTSRPHSVRPSAIVTPRPTGRPPICRHFLLQLFGNAPFLNASVPHLPVGKNIAISGLPPHSAIWKAYYQGQWRNISNVNKHSALVLAPGDKISVLPGSQYKYFHGAIPVNISYVNQSIASGSTLDVSALPTCHLAIIYLPRFAVPNFKILEQRKYMNEDDVTCKGKFALKTALKLDTPYVTPNMRPYTFNISNIRQKQYNDELIKINQSRPFAKLISTDLNNGQLFVITNGVKVEFFNKEINIQMDSVLCYQPESNYQGTVPVTLRACYKDYANKDSCASVTQVINIIVRPVNDRPVCKLSQYDLPAIPLNSWPNPNGTMVVNITNDKSLITDIDNATKGLAIVRAVYSSFGNFEYRFQGSASWNSIHIVNSRPYDTAGQKLNVLFLGPYDWIRFQANSNSSSWSKQQAMYHTSIDAYAWDASDGKSHGQSEVNIGSIAEVCKRLPGSLCCRPILIRQLKISGCDSKPGSVFVRDVCDVCGGDNSTCKGCDGVPGSGARFENQCHRGGSDLRLNHIEKIVLGATSGFSRVIHKDILLEDNLCDNEWHQVSVKILQDVTYAKVDVADAFTSSTTRRLELDHEVILGGRSSDTFENSQISKRNYKGCLSYVVLNDINVLQRLRKKRRSASFTCEDQPRFNPINFNQQTSSVQLPNPVNKLLNLKLSFRTYHRYGVLATNHESLTTTANVDKQQSTKLTLFIQHNQVKLRFKQKIVISMKPRENIDFGSWHNIKLSASQTMIILTLDGDSKSYRFSMTKPFILGPSLSLGSGVKSIPNFKGLMREISIDGKEVTYLNATRLDAVSIGKYNMEDMCFPNPCNNSGECIQIHNRSYCNCSGTNYMGATCSDKIPVWKRTCLEYYKDGSRTNDFYTIKPGSISFKVYCKMDHKDGPATIIAHDHDSNGEAIYESTESDRRFYYHVIKYMAQMNQLSKLIQISSHCQQYVKYTCLSSTLMFSNNKEAGLINRYGARWYSRQGVIQSYWGGAVKNSYSCACGTNRSCADNRLACNCDLMDNTWRSDDGYLSYKEDLPVTKLQFSKRHTNPSAQYQLGALECFGNSSIDKLKRNQKPATTKTSLFTTTQQTTITSFNSKSKTSTTEMTKGTSANPETSQTSTEITSKAQTNFKLSTLTQAQTKRTPAVPISFISRSTVGKTKRTLFVINRSSISMTQNPSPAKTQGSFAAERATSTKGMTKNKANIIVVHRPEKQSESSLSNHQMFILIALISSLTLFTLLLIVAVIRQRLFSCSSKKLTVELKQDAENPTEYAVKLPNNNTGSFSSGTGSSQSMSDINRIEIIKIGQPTRKLIPSESGSSVNSFDTSRYLEVGDESDSGSYTSYTKPKGILKSNKFIFTSRPRSEGNGFEETESSEIIGLIHVNKPVNPNEQTRLLPNQGNEEDIDLNAKHISPVNYHRHSSDCAQRESIDADTGFITDSSTSGNSHKIFSCSGSDESNDEYYASQKDKLEQKSKSVRFSFNSMKTDLSLERSLYAEGDDEVFS